MPFYPNSWDDQTIANQITREGYHWNQTTLYYSFNNVSTAGNSLNSAFQGWVNTAIQIVEEMVGIDFVKTTGYGHITFNGSKNDGTYATGEGNDPSNDLIWTSIYFDQAWETNKSANMAYGSYGLLTIIHELLHTLGLEHPGNYNVTASYIPDALFLQDTQQYSVMSYFDADENGSGTTHWFKTGETWTWTYAQTPMVYDLLALTDGAFAGLFTGYNSNPTTRIGDTTYGYNASAGINKILNFATNVSPVLTIYDAGGIDTLDLSGDNVATSRFISYDADGNAYPTDIARTSTVIDLRPGHYSSTNGMTNNIGIAFGTVIENAVGTKFDDTIIGNDESNVLSGKLGNDLIVGSGGNDVIDGGAGADKLYGGANGSYIYDPYFDSDTLSYLSSTSGVNINMKTGAASGGYAAGDVFVNFEKLLGSTFDDILTGYSNSSADGYSGNDYIFDSTRGSKLIGGTGSDWFVFVGNDSYFSDGTITDYKSDDTIFFVSSSLKIRFVVENGDVMIGGIKILNAANANLTVITQASATLAEESNVEAIRSVLAGGINAMRMFGAYSISIFDANEDENFNAIEFGYTANNLLDYTTIYLEYGAPYDAVKVDLDEKSNQKWSTATTYYSLLGNSVELEKFKITTYDAGQPFYQITTLYDLDVLDQESWYEINSYYSAPSVLNSYFIAFDAGQGYYGYNSDYDQAGNQTWSVINTYMATASVIDTYYVQFDAGQPYFAINSDYDQAGSQTWSTVNTYYSANSVIDYYRVTFDAGQGLYSFDINYDQASNQPWSSIATYYSAPGIIDSETTYYDSGQPLHSRFIDYDQGNAFAWNQHIVEYDTANHILNNYYI